MLQYFSANSNSFNNSTTLNVSNLIVPDERSEILAWLSPLEPRIRHQDVRERRLDNVGDWVLRTEEFRRWFDGGEGEQSDNAALFCCGCPGVGKTYLTSLVVDTLCDQAWGHNVAVACFYFDFAARNKQTPTNMLGALLRQVVSGMERIPNEIVQAFKNQKTVIGGRGLRLPEIVGMLQTTSSFHRTFICIDALDECLEGHQFKVLVSLKEILQKLPSVRIFLTGRPHVRGEVEKRLEGRVAILSVSASRDDITRYLQERLDEDRIPDAMDSSLVAAIVKRIPETVSEIFLLASLDIEAILQETTIYKRRERLREITDGLGLGDAYSATLERIEAQGGEKARLGIATLMWVSHSERPLLAEELCHALAIEIGSPSLDADNVPSIRTLLSCCQGLIVVDKASTVRLIHFTLQEHLRAHPNFFGRAHSAIAETCLTFLNFQRIKDIPADSSHDLLNTPFLLYSSLYWGTHAKAELSDRAESLALELLDHYNHHISAKLFFGAIAPRDAIWDGRFSALHCVSSFGIAKVALALTELKIWDANERDDAGLTPLIWAAGRGHEEVVKLLLEGGVDPDLPDTSYDATPLSWAAKSGHEGVVKLLLGREDVNPNRLQTYTGQTPLLCAAQSGHEGVVELLLGREDINPDRPDSFFGKTPLSWAAHNGYEGIVELLLGRGDVDPDRPDSVFGKTPLSWAAQNGNEGVVELLLGRDDVDPDSPDSFYGKTPLSWAAQNGHERIVKLLSTPSLP